MFFMARKYYDVLIVIKVIAVHICVPELSRGWFESHIRSEHGSWFVSTIHILVGSINESNTTSCIISS